MKTKRKDSTDESPTRSKRTDTDLSARAQEPVADLAEFEEAAPGEVGIDAGNGAAYREAIRRRYTTPYPPQPRHEGLNE